MADQAFLKDLFQDSVNGENPVVIVATDSHGNISGWNIAIINARKYLFRILTRHPRYLVRKLINELLPVRRGTNRVSRIPKEPSNNRQVDWPQAISVNWGENNPLVARHIDITVIANRRHSGIGKNLHLELEKALRKRSVQRIDACIHSENLISQLFHVKEGWALAKQDIDWLYITKELR